LPNVYPLHHARDVHRAVRAEGYPGCALGDPAEGYLEDVFTNHVGYGAEGCPFTCPHNARVLDCTQAHCLVAGDLGQRTVKLQVHPTMDVEDARDIGHIVKRVAEYYVRSAICPRGCPLCRRPACLHLCQQPRNLSARKRQICLDDGPDDLVADCGVAVHQPTAERGDQRGLRDARVCPSRSGRLRRFS